MTKHASWLYSIFQGFSHFVGIEIEEGRKLHRDV